MTLVGGTDSKPLLAKAEKPPSAKANRNYPTARLRDFQPVMVLGVLAARGLGGALANRGGSERGSMKLAAK
jgi:hypothetical protein